VFFCGFCEWTVLPPEIAVPLALTRLRRPSFVDRRLRHLGAYVAGSLGVLVGFVGAVPGQLAAFRVALNNQPSRLRASSHGKKIKRKISSCEKIHFSCVRFTESFSIKIFYNQLQ